ncbi:MAG: hypothetical protein ACKOSO_05060, partial [Actinomycetota bacterium]
MATTPVTAPPRHPSADAIRDVCARPAALLLLGRAHQDATAEAGLPAPLGDAPPLGAQTADRHPQRVRRAARAARRLDVADLARDEPDRDLVGQPRALAGHPGGALDVAAEADEVDGVAPGVRGHVRAEGLVAGCAPARLVGPPRLPPDRALHHEVRVQAVGPGAGEHARQLAIDGLPEAPVGLLEEHVVAAVGRIAAGEGAGQLEGAGHAVGDRPPA